jgi:hypothetical protein
MHDFLFRFGGGLPLHKVHFLIIRNPTVDLPTPSANFSPVVFPDVLITFPVLSRRSSFRFRFLVLLLPCCVARCLLRGVCDFEVLIANLFFIWFFRRPCSTNGPSWLRPLRRITCAQWVVLIPAMANSLHHPQISWVPVLRKSFLFRHTTAAWRDTFLQAAANFLRDPQFPRIRSFGSLHRPAVDF